MKPMYQNTLIATAGLLLMLLLGSLTLSASSSSRYAIGWSTFSQVGTAVSAGTYSLSGGSQAAQTTSQGETFSLTSGYWVGTQVKYRLYLPSVSAD